MTRSGTGALPRALAARAVDAVLRQGRNLDAALVFKEMGELVDRDKSLVHALAYGTLRTHLRNAALIDLLLEKPLKKKDSVIGALISVGLFALLESTQPDYAVVSANVSAADELGRPALRGLVNAVLRRFLRERDELLERVSDSVEARTLHPEWLVDKFQTDWPDDWESIVAAGNRQAPMWIRVNIRQQSPDVWLEQLHAADLAGNAPFPELPTAILLDQALPVTGLPGFANGDCSVQDIASQLAATLLQAEPGMRVLDACAAPGGKATHVLELCPDVVELVAVDQSAQRLERVGDNLSRIGQTATLVTGDALKPEAWWDGNGFDRILVDAPCSATGVIRRHPDIRYLRRAGDIAELVDVQMTMLEKLWPLLRPGGRLLYSTCSVLRAENEAVVAAFLEQRSDCRERLLPPAAFALQGALGQTAHGLQLLPGQLDNDGFYYAVMERLSD
jgi:16S rRNA (cytosine967-C5)-methyltransferase